MQLIGGLLKLELIIEQPRLISGKYKLKHDMKTLLKEIIAQFSRKSKADKYPPIKAGARLAYPGGTPTEIYNTLVQTKEGLRERL